MSACSEFISFLDTTDQKMIKLSDLQDLINRNAPPSADGSVLAGIHALVPPETKADSFKDQHAKEKRASNEMNLKNIVTLLNVAEQALRTIPSEDTTNIDGATTSSNVKDMWTKMCQYEKELDEINVAKRYMTQKNNFKQRLAEYDQLTEGTEKIQVLHNLMGMLFNFNAHPNHVDLYTEFRVQCIDRGVKLRVQLEQEMSSALGEDGIEWSKQYGASFRTERPHLSSRNHLGLVYFSWVVNFFRQLMHL